MAGTDPAARLRDASLRVTAQRTAVLQVLEQHLHSDAGFVARTVREGIGTVSLQAVYDVLAALSGVGIVRKFQPAGSPALFELRTGDNPRSFPGDGAGRRTEAARVRQGRHRGRGGRPADLPRGGARRPDAVPGAVAGFDGRSPGSARCRSPTTPHTAGRSRSGR